MHLLVETILHVFLLVLLVSPRRSVQFHTNWLSVVEVHEYLIQLPQLGTHSPEFQNVPSREAAVSFFKNRKQRVSPCWSEVWTSQTQNFLFQSDKLVVKLHLLLAPVISVGKPACPLTAHRRSPNR